MSNISHKSFFEIYEKKDCFGNTIYIYELNTVIGHEFLQFLKFYGKVNLFSDFSIPLITMDEESEIALSALFNSNRLQIRFKNDSENKLKQKFENQFNEFLEKINEQNKDKQRKNIQKENKK